VADFELTDEQRQVLRTVLPAVSDPELRDELARLAGVSQPPPALSGEGHLELGGSAVRPPKAMSGEGHLELGGGARAVEGVGSLVLAGTVTATAHIPTPTVTVTIDEQQTRVLSGIFQISADVIKTGDTAVDAVPALTRFAAWIMNQFVDLAEQAPDLLEQVNRWHH
jgi:hypothetical protein